MQRNDWIYHFRLPENMIPPLHPSTNHQFLATSIPLLVAQGLSPDHVLQTKDVMLGHQEVTGIRLEEYHPFPDMVTVTTQKGQDFRDPFIVVDGIGTDDGLYLFDRTPFGRQSRTVFLADIANSFYRKDFRNFDLTFCELPAPLLSSEQRFKINSYGYQKEKGENGPVLDQPCFVERSLLQYGTMGKDISLTNEYAISNFAERFGIPLDRETRDLDELMTIIHEGYQPDKGKPFYYERLFREKSEEGDSHQTADQKQLRELAEKIIRRDFPEVRLLEEPEQTVDQTQEVRPKR